MLEMDDRKPKRYGDDTMKMNTRMLDMNIHYTKLDDIKEILDRHKPLEIKCWYSDDIAYLSIDYEIVMRMTLYTEFRPKEEIIRLLRDTKNLTKTRMIDTENRTLHVRKDSTPYAPFAEEKEEDFSFGSLLASYNYSEGEE
jgi:hypothetical protein